MLEDTNDLHLNIKMKKNNITRWGKRSTFLLPDTSLTVWFDDTANPLEQLGNIHTGSIASPPAIVTLERSR